MSLTADIYDVFATQAGAFAAAQGLTISYPGIHFTPPDTGSWLELIPFWNDGIDYGVATSGPTVEQGFFRLMVCCRSGAGLTAPQQLAEAVIAAFPKGSTFGPASTDGMPSMGGPFQHDDRVVIPVTIRWRATR